MLPFGMFAYGEPRTVHTVYPACPESRREPRSAMHQSNRSASLILPPTRPLDFHHRRENPVTVCPLFATHTDRSQITENPATLSPFLATHTDLSPVSPVFATHTKTAGCMPTIPISELASLLPPVTSHKSPVTSMPHCPRIMAAPNRGEDWL